MGDTNTGDYNAGDCNTGYCNTGHRNTGDCNTGYRNTGDCNTGYRNTGDCNTGYCNTGDRNTGHRNTGYRNTGHRNTGDCNTGYCNTGDRNTGHRNTGYRNTGHRNTGDCNTGYRNTGDRNTGHRNTGYCNTVTPKEGLVFNKMANIEDITFPNRFYFDVKSGEGDDCCMWIPSDAMTNDEKKTYKTHETIGGYIKVSKIETDMKVHRRRAFDKCTDLDDIRKTLDIPNFDYSIFEEISGITKEDFDRKLGSKNEDILIKNGKKYRVEILEEIEG